MRVLNGSGVDGAAGRADQQLGNLGFVSGGTGNHEGGPVARTLIRYRPGDEAKGQLLAGFVPGAELVADASIVGGDVVLVIGSDFKAIGATVKGTAVTLAAERTPTAEEACN